MSRKYRLFGLLLLAALLLSACQPVVAQTQAPPSDEEVTAAVNAIWREYEASQMASDPDRWIALWTDDGVKMPPDTPALEGKEPIYARAQRGMTNAPADEMVITALETQSAGDWAYSRGTFTVTYTIAETGQQEMMDGKFMTILQRQPDGTWKIHRDIHNSNVPPAAPPEPDVATVTAEIEALFTEYGDSLAADDAERWIQLWVEDGVQLPPDAPPNVGRDVIFADISGAMEHYAYRDMDIQVDEVLVAGDLAIARGMYTVSLVPRDGSASILVDGKYTTTFQRQPDGSWKIYRDIFNSNVPPAAPPAAEVIDVDAATEAIKALWEEYSASALAGDPERRLALWAEDGIQMPPDREPRFGKDTIRAATEAGMANVVTNEYAVIPEEVQVFGDLAFARGTYSANRTPVSGGNPIQTDGKFMTILQRQADGSWKIYRDIFNSNVPPAPVAADGADIAALSAELHQRFSDNDLEGAAALADENIKMVGFGLGLDLEGREQFLNFMKARKRAFPDITLQHTNKVVQGDQVVVEFVATGTHLGPLMTPNGEVEATGKPVTLNVVEIHTWKDGKLVNLVQYQDPTSPLKQIGVMK